MILACYKVVPQMRLVEQLKYDNYRCFATCFNKILLMVTMEFLETQARTRARTHLNLEGVKFGISIGFQNDTHITINYANAFVRYDGEQNTIEYCSFIITASS